MPNIFAVSAIEYRFVGATIGSKAVMAGWFYWFAVFLIIGFFISTQL